MDEFVPVIDTSKPATVEKVDWGISSSEDEGGDSKNAITIDDPFKDDPFSSPADVLNNKEVAPEMETKTSQDDQSTGDDKADTSENQPASDSQIHQMLQFFNKKYEENTGSSKSPEIPIPKVEKIPLEPTPVESTEPEEKERDDNSLQEVEEEAQVEETAAMEKAWESDSTDDEQKTQISTKVFSQLLNRNVFKDIL